MKQCSEFESFVAPALITIVMAEPEALRSKDVLHEKNTTVNHLVNRRAIIQFRFTQIQLVLILCLLL